MVDSAARRLIVASAVRLHVAQRRGTGPVAADLLGCARRLTGTGEVERRYSVTFDPAYPGVTAGVEGSRLVLLCAAAYRGETVATVVTTLVAGRAPLVTAAPPSVEVPTSWSPP